MSFPTAYDEILQRVEVIEPQKYGRTRNFVDGAITKLSPYISRGVISTRFVMNRLIERGFTIKNSEKLFQELAWRDYWQRIWQHRGNEINRDLKKEQPNVHHQKLPAALDRETTGIQAIDKDIELLKSSGYMHNHMRMYLASVACVFGHAHWSTPAKWMYYYLLDADWASNALSWQWVAGSNSNKVYLMNQENINKYWRFNQYDTYLDRPYDLLPINETPQELVENISWQPKTNLPQSEDLQLNEHLPTLVYNLYNLDPTWHQSKEVNRILLFEPEHFNEFPMADHTIQFMLDLAKNIPQIQIFVGSFSELQNKIGESEILFKEHPTNDHFSGHIEERDWMFPTVTKEYRSFFSYWKACLKSLQVEGQD